MTRLPIDARRMNQGFVMAGSAVRGLLAGIVGGSAAFVALIVVQSLSRPDQLVSLLKALPAFILILPNVAVGLAIAASGAPFRVDQAGLGTSAGRPISLYQAPPEVIAVGLVALILPGVIAGLTLRARRPASTPLEVAGAGAVVAVLLLITAAVGLPSMSMTSTSAFVAGSRGSAGVAFDFAPAVIVGGLVSILTTIVAFRLGPAPRTSE